MAENQLDIGSQPDNQPTTQDHKTVQQMCLVSNKSAGKMKKVSQTESHLLGCERLVQPNSPSADLNNHMPNTVQQASQSEPNRHPEQPPTAQHMYNFMVQYELNSAYRHFANLWMQAQLLQQWHLMSGTVSLVPPATHNLDRSKTTVLSPPPPYEGPQAQSRKLADQGEGITGFKKLQTKHRIGKRRQPLNSKNTSSLPLSPEAPKSEILHGKRKRDYLMEALGLTRINTPETEKQPAKQCKQEHDEKEHTSSLPDELHSDSEIDHLTPASDVPPSSNLVSQRFAQEFHEQVFRETFLNDKRDDGESIKMANEWRTELEKHGYGMGK